MFVSNFLRSFHLIIIDYLVILCIFSVCFYHYAIYAAITFFGHPQPTDLEFHPPVVIPKKSFTACLMMKILWFVVRLKFALVLCGD